MKISVLFLGLCLILFGSCKKNDRIDEIPKEIIRVYMDPIIYTRIVDNFPDQVNAVENVPCLFSDTVQKKIILTKESEVYVTFIAEGALYKNTLGFYYYTEGMAPSSTDELDEEIIFPNISGVGEGGLLNQGDMMQLGNRKFPAGTVIGFFLISDGWENGSINYNKPTYYTDYQYNAPGTQQHILFIEKGSKNIILGFEDSDFKLPTTDKDFNDILFNVTDNRDGFENISFNTENIPEL
jgi:hypothetical protein